jgi:hypothetical protein
VLLAEQDVVLERCGRGRQGSREAADVSLPGAKLRPAAVQHARSHVLQRPLGLGQRAVAAVEPENASWTVSSAAARSPSMTMASLIRPTAWIWYREVTTADASCSGAA